MTPEQKAGLAHLAGIYGRPSRVFLSDPRDSDGAVPELLRIEWMDAENRVSGLTSLRTIFLLPNGDRQTWLSMEVAA